MKANFVKFNEAIKLLHNGWEIYTRRGSAPWSPIYFKLCFENEDSKSIHYKTIDKLIKQNVINGTDVSTGKYKLIIHD